MTDLTPAEQALIDDIAPHAARALHAAQHDDWEAASDAVELVYDTHGPHGVQVSMIVWIDTLLFIAPKPPTSGLARPVWHCSDCDALTGDAHEVKPAVAWAGQLITARANKDYDLYDALLNALPDGQEADYLSELLSVVALSIKTAIRGHHHGAP